MLVTFANIEKMEALLGTAFWDEKGFRLMGHHKQGEGAQNCL